MTKTRQIAAIASVLALLLMAPPGSAQADSDGPLPGPIDNPVNMHCTLPPAPDVDFHDCDFTGADFTGIDLTGANLDGANLANANLSGATLDDVTAIGASFGKAGLIGASLVDADLTRAILRGASLKNADLTDATLDHADVDAAVLSGALLPGASLDDADMAGAIVDGTDLSDASLQHIDAHGVDFSTTDLTDADLAGADLVGTNLSTRDLSQVALTGADLTKAVLRKATLVEANLTGANLTNASLLGADTSRMLQDKITWWNTTCPDGMVVSGSPCAGIRQGTESGFVTLAPISYAFPTKAFVEFDYTTTEAHVFYTFQPADSPGAKPQDAPVFVMLNGGPGAATTANLFANNTAKYTVNVDMQKAGGPGYALNPYSWTSMGNLLYIDPPQTGFSFNVNPDAATNDPLRFVDYFFTGNFNPYIDADQVLRVVLQFLDTHPALQDNPVVLVGESYGGTRVSTMLNMVLFPEAYGAKGKSFRDPGLVAQLTSHFAAIGIDSPLTPERTARQFGRQVLIQPQLSSYQTDVQTDMYWTPKGNASVIDAVADASGHPGGFTRDKSTCGVLKDNLGACAIMRYVAGFGRDRYNWTKGATWSDDQEAYTSAQFEQLGKLNVILGTDFGAIPGVKAPARNGNAYHFLAGIPWMNFDEDGLADVPGASDSQLDALSAGIADGAGQTGWLYPGIVAAQGAADAAVANVPVDDSLTANLGKLLRYDRYYLAWNPDVYAAYAFNYFTPEYLVLGMSQDTSPRYGDMFLLNARYVDTFLTDAEYDLVIYSPALPVALSKHDGISSVLRQRSNHEENGIFGITYQDGKKVTLYYPYYASSGHAVGASQPEKLRNDVAAWLRCTSDGTCSSNG